MLYNILEECIKYNVISGMGKAIIVIALHKNVSIHLESNYRLVSLMCFLCRFLKN